MLTRDSVDLRPQPYHFLIVCDLGEFLLGRPYFEMFLDSDHSPHLFCVHPCSQPVSSFV